MIKNDIHKTIIDYTILFLLTLFSIIAGIQSYRISSLTKHLERYRSELADARRANEQYADTFRRATETNTEIRECLSEHVSTLAELREKIGAVRAGYEQMQEIFESLADIDDLNRSVSGSGGNPL